MFGHMPAQLRKSGSLNLKVGDMVRMNPDAMLNGGGLAIVVSLHEDIPGVHHIRYLKDGYEVPADDMIDILEVVSRANG
tara:strand:+ start:809 stop:1045 length:237 start_codon:yes stop_codon:yes gene_type:complete